MEKLDGTPTKLRDGSWGVRVSGGTAKSGYSVMVRTKSGKSWVTQIGKVLWTDDKGGSICTTERERRDDSGWGRRGSNGGRRRYGDGMGPSRGERDGTGSGQW